MTGPVDRQVLDPNQFIGDQPGWLSPFDDEVFVKIKSKQDNLWRAVDQDGEVVDVFLQSRRDGNAAKRYFKRLIQSAQQRTEEDRHR